MKERHNNTNSNKKEIIITTIKIHFNRYVENMCVRAPHKNYYDPQPWPTHDPPCLRRCIFRLPVNLFPSNPTTCLPNPPRCWLIAIFAFDQEKPGRDAISKRTLKRTKNYDGLGAMMAAPKLIPWQSKAQAASYRLYLMAFCPQLLSDDARSGNICGAVVWCNECTKTQKTGLGPNKSLTAAAPPENQPLSLLSLAPYLSALINTALVDC